jgi:hypothetical protein
VASLETVGRYPDSNAVIVPKSYADADNAATAVTNAYIDQQCAIQAANCVSQAYITQAVANYATASQLSAADALFVPNTLLGAANGVATTLSNGLANPAQLPTLVTNRLPVSYSIATTGTDFLGGDSFTVTTTTLQEYIIASMPIPDPGYPWIPWVTVYISGQAAGSPSGSRFIGNGNFGLLTVMPPSGVSSKIYAAGVCTSDTVTNWYQATPYGGAQNPQTPTTPLTQPPIIGPLTLDLGCCCWQGNGYTFNGPGKVFHVTVLPAMGTGQLPS